MHPAEGQDQDDVDEHQEGRRHEARHALGQGEGRGGGCRHGSPVARRRRLRLLHTQTKLCRALRRLSGRLEQTPGLEGGHVREDVPLRQGERHPGLPGCRAGSKGQQHRQRLRRERQVAVVPLSEAANRSAGRPRVHAALEEAQLSPGRDRERAVGLVGLMLRCIPARPERVRGVVEVLRLGDQHALLREAPGCLGGQLCAASELQGTQEPGLVDPDRYEALLAWRPGPQGAPITEHDGVGANADGGHGVDLLTLSRLACRIVAANRTCESTSAP